MAVTRPSRVPELALSPMVDGVGPFPSTRFLQAWWEELSPPGELLVAEQHESALVLVDYGDRIEFAGESDLTDYHSPLGRPSLEIAGELASELLPEGKLSLDSLPAEAAKLLAEALGGSFAVDVSEHDVAMVLDLPPSIDDYYSGLGKKDRHELRRKRRRYEHELGSLSLTTSRGPGHGIDEFIRQHRLSEGPKGSFMTPEREAFFRRLAAQPGWRVDLLASGDAATACLFAWSDETGYYLYNSSYDPSFTSLSPGLMLLSASIEDAIKVGLTTFDFLKGSEPYKSRLGATPRPLFRIDARVLA